VEETTGAPAEAENSGLAAAIAAAEAEGRALQAGADEGGIPATDEPTPEGLSESVASQSDTSSQETAAEGSDEQGSDEQATAEAEAAAAAEDAADLEQYPESVRDRFRALDRAERKALYEHAETRARQQIETANARAAELKAAADARQAEIDKILASQGKYVGNAPIEIRWDDGTVTEGPTYDELVTLSSTRSGREQLLNKYGLDEAGTEVQRARIEENRAMLGASAQLLEDGAWSSVAAKFKTGLEQVEGINPDDMVADASGPDDVIVRLARTLNERHAREVTTLKQGYEDRITALTENAEGLKGRALAGSSRQMATGGRTGGGSSTSTLQRLIDDAGGSEAFAERAARGEYAGIDLSK
jgi:hypothetical protein